MQESCCEIAQAKVVLQIYTECKVLYPVANYSKDKDSIKLLTDLQITIAVPIINARTQQLMKPHKDITNPNIPLKGTLDFVIIKTCVLLFQLISENIQWILARESAMITSLAPKYLSSIVFRSYFKRKSNFY